MKITHFKPITFILLLSISLSVFAQSDIYVGGYFRRDRTVTVPKLKASGFTCVILFNIEVQANGDLTTDGETICTNGKYVFGNTQPYYVDDVNALHSGMTSVRRIETCVGGWGSISYGNIKTLVNAQGIGTSSVLYKNFKALKDTIPLIEAVNNDDESTYDVATATSFHVMLFDLGFKTTLAPYTNKSFWQSLATNVNNQRPGAVERIYLQCYGGGVNNNPLNWNINNIEMHAGMLNTNPAATITSQMTTWKNSSTVEGGFLWVYNSSNINLKNCAASIAAVFGGGEVANVDKMKPHITVYSEKNYQGKTVNFEAGKYIKAAISAQAFPDLSLSSIKLSPGFKIELYATTDCTGTFNTITDNISDFKASYTAPVNSWIVRTTGDPSFSNKKMYIRNRKSGLYMTIASDSYDVGINIQQKGFTGNNNQKWLFTHLGDGLYQLQNTYSSKSIGVKDAVETENALLIQDVYSALLSQKFILKQTESNGFYKFIPLNSLKYVGIEINEANTNIIQSSLLSDETDWELIDESAAGVASLENNGIRIYPNPVSNYLYIDKESLIKSVEVIDIKGSTVISQDMNKNYIDVSKLNNGEYLLKIYFIGKNTPFISKIIKK